MIVTSRCRLVVMDSLGEIFGVAALIQWGSQLRGRGRDPLTVVLGLTVTVEDGMPLL